MHRGTWDPYLTLLDRLVDMGNVFKTPTLLEEDFGIPSSKGDLSLREKADLFPFGSASMRFYSLMSGMKRNVAKKNIYHSVALLNWLWDPDIIWNERLFQVIKNLSKIQAFEFDIEYNKGKMNVVDDALSRKPILTLIKFHYDWKTWLGEIGRAHV